MMTTGFRINKATIKRADALAVKMALDEDLVILRQMTRSVVMRIAILQGLRDKEKNANSVLRKAAPFQDLLITDQQKHVSVSLPVWLIDRAQKIADRSKTTRAEILRSCLINGLLKLEDTHD